MADEQLSALFAQAEAPAADPEFVQRVSRAIARERRARRLAEFATAGATAVALFLIAPVVGSAAARADALLAGFGNQSLLFLAFGAVVAGWGLARAYA